MLPSYLKSPTPDFQNEYYYQYDESLGSSTTSSGTFQNKLTINTPTLPAGNYRIGWTFNYAINQSDRRGEYRVAVDGTAGYSVLPEQNRKDYFFPVGGFLRTTFASAGTHSITIDYRTDNASSVSIEQARLEIWRID